MTQEIVLYLLALIEASWNEVTDLQQKKETLNPEKDLKKYVSIFTWSVAFLVCVEAERRKKG